MWIVLRAEGDGVVEQSPGPRLNRLLKSPACGNDTSVVPAGTKRTSLRLPSAEEAVTKLSSQNPVEAMGIDAVLV